MKFTSKKYYCAYEITDGPNGLPGINLISFNLGGEYDENISNESAILDSLDEIATDRIMRIIKRSENSTGRFKILTKEEYDMAAYMMSKERMMVRHGFVPLYVKASILCDNNNSINIPICVGLDLDEEDDDSIDEQLKKLSFILLDMLKQNNEFCSTVKSTPTSVNCEWISRQDAKALGKINNYIEITKNM